jgi:hypothetical protein
MSKNLTYNKKAKKKGFVDVYFNNRFESLPKAPSASEAFVYDIANEHRDFFKPIFANETQYLPNGNFRGSQVSQAKPNYSETLDVVSNSTRPSTQSLTIPPNKKPDNLLLKGLVLGAGIFLVYQILED